MGECDPPTSGGEINGGGVDVWANQNGNGGGSGASRGNDGGADSPPSDQVAPTDPFLAAMNNPNCAQIPRNTCTNIFNNAAGPTDPSAGVSIQDVARFFAEHPSNHMQPKNWMVVGLDTNFYASAPAQVVRGEVLDQPASVRFTPVGYRWEYGDGASANRVTPGSTWAALGVPEFSPTATSHVYRSPGTYTISLAVYYSAQYRFAGQSWANVNGILRMSANDLTVTAGDAKTVLVERDCTVAPRGPGC